MPWHVTFSQASVFSIKNPFGRYLQTGNKIQRHTVYWHSSKLGCSNISLIHNFNILGNVMQIQRGNIILKQIHMWGTLKTFSYTLLPAEMTAPKMLKILFINNLVLCTRYSHQTQHKLYLYSAFINWSDLHSFSPWNVKAFSPEIVTTSTRARLSFEKVMITDLCFCSSLTNDSEGLSDLLLYCGSGTTTSTNCTLPHWWNVCHRTVS